MSQQQRVRPQVRNQIDQAIQSNVQAKSPRSGIGLVIPTNGRYRTLYDKNGITAAGRYYYSKTGLPEPGKFDFQQDSIRKGRSQFISLLDGSQKKISTWDNVNREWKLTALGRTFYSKAVDRFVVLFPVRIQLTRINGSIFEREDFMPSTSIESLGEIEVPRSLGENQQRTRVAQIERTWRDQQPTIEGEKVLLAGYETFLLDTSRPIQYNKLSVTQAGDVEAVMHRPLRDGKPWNFHGLDGICPESLHQTEDSCVSYQLSRYIRVKGEAPWTQVQIAEMLLDVTEELYENDPENDPYDGEAVSKIGFTAAAITQLCRDLCVPIHIKWGDCKIESYIPERPEYEAVALYIWGDHCFTVADAAVKKAIIKERIGEAKADDHEVLATIARRTNVTPASQYWETYTKLQPGHFSSSDLMQIRADLLRDGICPRLKLSGTGVIRELRYNDCFVHAWPHEAHICLKFLEEYGKTRHHSIAYRGESLATFGQMIFDDLNRQCDRPFLTKEVKKELCGRQNGKCAHCGDERIDQVDHQIPRGANCHGADSIANYNYLCLTCHREKTQQDHQRMNVEDPNCYLSRFNQETFEGFVKSRKPTQVVCNLHEAVDELKCMEIDVRSCRLNGIVEGNVHDIPVFSPLDEFTKPVEGIIADYSWVDLGAIKSPLTSYIYDGSRWYDRATVQFMFEIGICKWRNIKLSFSATCHRPASDLSSKLKRMQKVWYEVGSTFQGVTWAGAKAQKKDTRELLAKTAMLSMLGSWGRTSNYRHSMVTTSHPDDVPWCGEVSSRPTPGSETTTSGYVFHDYSWKQEVLSLGSFLPLNLIGRSQERLQVARALCVVRRYMEPRNMLSIQVDGLYVQPANRDFKKLQNEIKRLRYCDLHTISPPLIRSVNHVRQDASKSTELVYKANECQPRFPGGVLKVAADHVDPPYHDELTWTTYTEPKHGPDEFLEQILDHVNMGKSFSCLGSPGVGKTWVLAKVKEQLEELNQKVVCLAPTHAAARLLPSGDTIHHFVSKYAMRGAFKGWILLDEVSMCGLGLLAALDQLRMNGTKICTFGDWQQLPPHPESNSWRGQPVCATAFQQSRLYKSWSDCTCFELTRCRRSDEAHFEFYTSLPQNLSKAIKESRKRYLEKDEADLHVTMSHRKRRVISTAKQAQAAVGKECVEIPGGDDPKFQCFVGTRVVGNSTCGKIVNGGRYTVTCIGQERVCLKDEMTDDEFEVSLDNVSKHCILAWALCYPKVQGCTERGTVMLHDMASPYLKRCHLYVGLSRVTDGSNVYISSD